MKDRLQNAFNEILDLLAERRELKGRIRKLEAVVEAAKEYVETDDAEALRTALVDLEDGDDTVRYGITAAEIKESGWRDD